MGFIMGNILGLSGENGKESGSYRNSRGYIINSSIILNGFHKDPIY